MTAEGSNELQSQHIYSTQSDHDHHIFCVLNQTEDVQLKKKRKKNKKKKKKRKKEKPQLYCYAGAGS